MRYVVKLTRDQAEKLGILRCASCGYPRNNHFSFGKKVCAHSTICTGWKPYFITGKPIAISKRAKPPIHRKRRP